MFLEQIVHPEVRTGGDQQRFVNIINYYIARDEFELVLPSPSIPLSHHQEWRFRRPMICRSALDVPRSKDLVDRCGRQSTLR